MSKLNLLENQVLSVSNLNISFSDGRQDTAVVNNLSFTLERGQTLALVGESGAGKSVVAMALMQLTDPVAGKVKCDAMLLRRRNDQVVSLSNISKSQLQSVRGADIAMVFQEPMRSLNPVFTVGEQVAESIRLHQGLSFRNALHEAERMLERVRIPDAAQVLSRYPHQLSGGMRQRVMIAMALSSRPAVLIADEPTTALDVTIQAQILQLIRVLQQEMDMGVIFITHDISVVAGMADRILVMQDGSKVEEGETTALLNAPQHPYTREMLASVLHFGAMQGNPLPRTFPSPNDPAETIQTQQNTVSVQDKPVLSVSGLIVRFPICTGVFNRVTRQVHAVEQLSFDLWPGETLALMGESGCGKSSVGRALLRLIAANAGVVDINGYRMDTLQGAKLQAARRDIQYIPQDPWASLDPRMTVGETVMEPLLIHRVMSRADAGKYAVELLVRVGLKPEHALRFPHQFSGGQRQRICIARALALKPKVIIADEPVSSLDMPIRGQIMNLLMSLQRETGIACLLISHDMAVVERISHRVAVMYLGQIVEVGTRQDVFENPLHPYTQRLLSAVPVVDPARRHRPSILLSDDPPSPIRRIGDEPFVAPLLEISPGHFVARHPILGAVS
ncbi:dipeptide ABC transporter ATP-binding protein [Mangrovibacter yixingensis]|uniref:dipeptide ABC transporter ATP-binding protein n=1 Tax=Mangrovibacter yixingensis TaxID=1529639 RepID=UPI001CFA1F22|nr:dipeptide ABC transporter ATP-binding protein [Mangrovibacter yixingensis]